MNTDARKAIESLRGRLTETAGRDLTDIGVNRAELRTVLDYITERDVIDYASELEAKVPAEPFGEAPVFTRGQKVRERVSGAVGTVLFENNGVYEVIFVKNFGSMSLSFRADSLKAV